MNAEELKDKLEANGLGKYFDALRPQFRNAIRLRPKAAGEDAIAIGQTKIGGKPDLPEEIDWPTETGMIETARKFLIFGSREQKTFTRPLSFIAQINLSETARYDSENLLPESGYLYFFYSTEQDAWGFDYKDRNSFKVIYWDGNVDELRRMDFPENFPGHARYTACSVDMECEISLPPDENEVYKNFTDEEHDVFFEILDEDGTSNKLLGYSDNIQGKMELECELVTNGLFCGNPSGYNDPKAKLLEPNAGNWRLLLQIDSNEENDMMWGDSGRLYFWIKKDDLSDKNFDNAWFILQCY